jgi:hypothetical protein
MAGFINVETDEVGREPRVGRGPVFISPEAIAIEPSGSYVVVDPE